MRKRDVFTLACFVLFSWQAGRAQIVVETHNGNQTVVCVLDGLSSTHKDCGARAEWFKYVFVGTISAVTPIDDREMEVRVVPEEVFRGAPPVAMTVVTSQGQCLGELAAGDRWLFYLQQEEGKPMVLAYGGRSHPVADAEEEIETLRRLRNLDNLGIVRGHVGRGSSPEEDAVPQAKVVAERQSDRLKFVSTTDEEGRFEMEPLPPGNYKIAVDPIGSYQPDDDDVEVGPGDCWDVMIYRSPHAEIRGHVRRNDGLGMANVDVVLFRSDDSSYETTQTDETGQFEFGSLAPGEFLIGLNFPARADWFNGSGFGERVEIPPASLFYPGAVSRTNAKTIRLAIDEKIGNLDFVLSAP